MRKLILVINTGSSSIKFSIFEWLDSSELACIRQGAIEGFDASSFMKVRTLPEGHATQLKVAAKDFKTAVQSISKWAQQEFTADTWCAIGHRIVHGGQCFTEPLMLNEDNLTKLRELIPLDPIHLPLGIAAIDICGQMFKDVLQIAVFDTAFHSTQPKVATTIALPRTLTDTGIQRFGFHGVSFQFIASALQHIDPKLAAGKTLVAHLGSGASLCALKCSKSIATTMGFSVLDGLVMGTRCGSIDPGVLLYLLNSLHISPEELEEILYKKSGLLGLSGLSGDVRVLLGSSDPKAKEALDIFVYRIVREIGSLVAALEGLDGIVFTGGIGEHSSEIRERVIAGLAWLGCEIDKSANSMHGEKISAPTSKLAVYVIRSDENLMVARQIVQRYAAALSK